MNLTLEDRTTTLKFYVENYQTKERLDLDSYEIFAYAYPFNSTFASIQKTERLEDENSYLITVYAENNTYEYGEPTTTLVGVDVTLYEGVGVCVYEDGTPSSGLNGLVFCKQGAGQHVGPAEDLLQLIAQLGAAACTPSPYTMAA